jgi:hypothetical protein
LHERSRQQSTSAARLGLPLRPGWSQPQPVLYQLVKVFYEWRQQNNSVFAFFILLGGTNIDALNVLSSRLLGLGMFSAPWGDNTKRTLNVLGLVGLVLEE